MNRSYSKWYLPEERKQFILISLIVIPSIILWTCKEVVKTSLPTLAVVSGIHVDTLVDANGYDSIITKYPIPIFSFINQDHDTITNEYYKGKIYIANFMFTRCPTICKDMTFNMEYLQGKLSKYDDILYLSHTIDPDYDTPEILKEYAERCQNEL